MNTICLHSESILSLLSEIFPLNLFFLDFSQNFTSLRYIRKEINSCFCYLGKAMALHWMSWDTSSCLYSGFFWLPKLSIFFYCFLSIIFLARANIYKVPMYAVEQLSNISFNSYIYWHSFALENLNVLCVIKLNRSNLIRTKRYICLVQELSCSFLNVALKNYVSTNTIYAIHEQWFSNIQIHK